jgi:pimeloyl-ACP methyl ester carboxylesterase
MRFLFEGAGRVPRMAATDPGPGSERKPDMKPQTPRVRKPLALVLLACSWIADSPALDPDAFVPPGSFASLGTHRLYFDCKGTGAPRVLIDYGIAGAAIEWGRIQQALARETTVCVYDRAGYGWSDPGPSPRTAGQAATELAALAEAAGWREPLLLVGHSFGGFDVRTFAARHPTAVAGLVLLDSSLPGLTLSGAPAAAIAGARHPLDTAALSGEPDRDEFAIARYLNSRRKAVFTQMDELGNFGRSGDETAAAGALPAVPLVVVTRDPARGLPDAAAEAQWQRGQELLARLVPDGEWWTAARSGHEIHRDRPDVVIDAVRRVLERLRDNGG